MIKFIKKYGIYFVLFFFFLFWGLFLQPLYLDEVWTYGFSHSIYDGLVPYVDFNMVITPFYPFFLSLFFHLFGSSMLVLHIVNASLLTFLFFILFQLIKEKSYIFLLLLCYPLSIAFPNYNLFLLILFVLLLYLEKKKSNDYVIGIVLAISILTKQTVGVLLCLPSLFYLKDYKKILKRYDVVLLGILLFIIYLGFSHSFSSFLDLCFFGLFDFGGANGNIFNLYSVISVFLLIILYFVHRKNKSIYFYYVLAFFSNLIPIFDIYHFEIFFFGLLVVFFLIKPISIHFPIKLFVLGILFGTSAILTYWKVSRPFSYPNSIPHFEWKYASNEQIQYTNKVNKKIEEYGIENTLLLFSDSYYFKIINDSSITYFDLINYGNWGMNGTDKLIARLKKEEGKIVFIEREVNSDSNSQINKKAISYVKKNGVFIDKVLGYDIYRLGDEV